MATIFNDLKKKIKANKFDTTKQITTVFWDEIGEEVQDKLITKAIPVDSEYVFDFQSLIGPKGEMPTAVDLQNALNDFNVNNPYMVKGTKDIRIFSDGWIRKCKKIEDELNIKFIEDLYGLYVLFSLKWEKKEKTISNAQQNINELTAELNILQRNEN